MFRPYRYPSESAVSLLRILHVLIKLIFQRMFILLRERIFVKMDETWGERTWDICQGRLTLNRDYNKGGDYCDPLIQSLIIIPKTKL